MVATHTVGFVFNSDLSQVLLIRKNRPEWQQGLLNGPGGRVEGWESAEECIVREILEETALQISADQWQQFCTVHEGGRIIEFYVTTYGEMTDANSMTDELVEWLPVDRLPNDVITNLQWLIPMGREVLLEERVVKGEVRYT